jgi:pimeloyl-ACP methyl ester carboxylesterase
MPTLNLPRGPLYYTDRKGKSPYPPLLLVHGAGGSHLDWPPELRRLPQTRVIVPDLPGHGRSAGPGRADTLEYAADVCGLLDALHIGRAIIAGHSMGGAVAQQIALNWPDRAVGLILIGTGSKLPVEPTLPQRIVDEPEKTVDWLVEWSWGANAPPSLKALGRQRLLEILPEILRGDYLACQAFDVRDRLELIVVSTLVLGGAQDHMVPLKFATFLAEHIPKAQLVVIEGAGHMFPLEEPQTVADSISDWLARHVWTE